MYNRIFQTIVIVLVASVTISQGRVLTPTERQSVYIDCYRSSGMDPEVVAQAIKNEALLEPTPAYLAQLTCIYKGQGYQNDDGEIVPSDLKQFLGKVYTEEECNFIVDNCASTGGTSHGEIAYRAFACMLKNLKKVAEDKVNENKV